MLCQIISSPPCGVFRIVLTYSRGQQLMAYGAFWIWPLKLWQPSVVVEGGGGGPLPVLQLGTQGLRELSLHCAAVSLQGLHQRGALPAPIVRQWEEVVEVTGSPCLPNSDPNWVIQAPSGKHC